jgi:transposase
MFETAAIKLSAETIEKLSKRAERARRAGDIGMLKRVEALLALSHHVPIKSVSKILRCSPQTIYNWIKDFILRGLASLVRRKSPGRPSRLKGGEKKRLGEMLDAGPEAAGYPGACWRSPMIQDLIYREFGKFFSVKYIAELLKNMGFSYQKAKFESDHLDEEKRERWLKDVWPEILTLSRRRNAVILFGDEASFPMWGSLSRTWSRKGCQPTVKTSGKRKGYKVFGLIRYHDGKFYASGTEGRFNSDSYVDFVKGVLSRNKRHVILIQDGAPYHVSRKTRDFFESKKDRLTVYRLPSYSPDYNPIEKLWKKIKEKHIHLHYFPTFGALKDKVQEALVAFEKRSVDVLSLFGFYRKLEMSKA